MNSSFKKESGVEIRDMTIDDLADVYAIDSIGQVVSWSASTFKDCLEAGYNGWVLLHDRVITGYILAYVRSGECHILNFCVKPEMRGMGLGSQLLEHVLTFAKDHGADMAILEVRPSNHPAIYLYHKVGFNEISVRKDYYATPEGGREDALVLVLEFKKLDE